MITSIIEGLTISGLVGFIGWLVWSAGRDFGYVEGQAATIGKCERDEHEDAFNEQG